MSIKIIRERQRVEDVYWTIDFDDGHYNGFTFPANEDGSPAFDKMMDIAIENYNWCLQHPERFERFNKLLKHTNSYMQPALAKCHCGEEFELVNEYEGACQCPKCKLWVNLFGQELKSPKYWEDDCDEEYEDWDDDSSRGCSDCPDDECTGHCMSCYYRPV